MVSEVTGALEIDFVVRLDQKGNMPHGMGDHFLFQPRLRTRLLAFLVDRPQALEGQALRFAFLEG